MAKPKKQRMINASEISEYVFCAKAWHLKRSGGKPQSPRIDEGNDYHKEHEGELLYASRLKQAAIFCVAAASLLLLGLLFLRLLIRAR